MESVSISAAILNSVVDDILNLNEIEANHIMLRKEVFQPHFTVNSICDILRPDAKRKGLFLSVISSPQLADLSVIGDSVRLSQVLMNLIGNSIRYTEKGHIEVAVDSKHSNDNQVQISFKVSDTGIGIPQEFQAHIFEPFKIIHAHSKKQYHGTGFGLPLVRKLVNLLGGVLDFTSQEGLGTTFSFSIPYPVSVKPTPVETTKPVNSLAPLDLRVLIAEDNKMNTLVLTNFLKKWQVQFTAVENGLLAVESIKQGHYDAVLMDINMPIMDGIEASRQIRSLKQEAKSSVTIIALTAANVKSFEANPNVIKLFDDWMSKPFHPQKLHEKLSKLI